MFEEINGKENQREIRGGDFNAHNSLWGGDCADNNGEEMMDTRDTSLYK